ncbi:MAG: hypothetical protein R3326_03775 [Gemmatimonadota bacterium]|nr:hypothetical protein [Gemmatimonadota bacterium]
MLAPYVRGFIRASLVWLVVGIVVGLSMVFWPGDHLVYRPAHAHANLLGFVSMFIFGVAYHVLPRFVGRPLSGERWAMPHLWIQNVGLAAMVTGWFLRPTWWTPGQALLWIGGTLSAIGVGIFVTIAWRTTGARTNTEFTPPGQGND